MVFEIMLSLRDQCAHWSWQSPGSMEPCNDYHQKSQVFPFFGCFSVHFPSNRGIATPVCALVRNDSIFWLAFSNTNLSVCRAGNPGGNRAGKPCFPAGAGKSGLPAQRHHRRRRVQINMDKIIAPERLQWGRSGAFPERLSGELSSPTNTS